MMPFPAVTKNTGQVHNPEMGPLLCFFFKRDSNEEVANHILLFYLFCQPSRFTSLPEFSNWILFKVPGPALIPEAKFFIDFIPKLP
jgi:hypothetical protein